MTRLRCDAIEFLFIFFLYKSCLLEKKLERILMPDSRKEKRMCTVIFLLVDLPLLEMGSRGTCSRRTQKVGMDSTRTSFLPHLWCQRTWWRHTPLCISFTPTQGRIIKYQIFYSSNQGKLFISFSFSRLTSNGLKISNGSGNELGVD